MPGNTSDRLDQIKKAFRGLFRRKKATATTAGAPQLPIARPIRLVPQMPQRIQRPRSYSAVAAPEVYSYQQTTEPSWPIFGQLPTAGGFYCSPVELPGSLVPMQLQQRSHSDVGPPTSISDLFSELDANSVRRLSVVEDEEAIPELASPVIDGAFQFEGHAESDARELEEQQAENEDETVVLEEPLEKGVHTKETTNDELKKDVTEEKEEEQSTTEKLLDPADIPLPESADPDIHSPITAASASSQVTLPRNDSPYEPSKKEEVEVEEEEEEVSSLYSTDHSSDYDSATDEATVSTPRTSSMRAETMEYFDEKIPVIEERPQIRSIVAAPGMAATSGPLNDFPFR